MYLRPHLNGWRSRIDIYEECHFRRQELVVAKDEACFSLVFKRDAGWVAAIGRQENRGRTIPLGSRIENLRK